MKVIAQRDDGIRILRMETLADAEAWMPAFVGAYQAIWSEPPYNERFLPDEAAGVLRRAVEVTENVTLLAVRESGVVVGFGIAYPVLGKSDVARDIRGLLPVEDTFYFAELGVLEAYRDRGLGHQLVALRLELIDRQRFRHVLLRTSATRHAGYEMYRKMGFEDTGVYMEVPSRRNDGSTRTDRRLFLSMLL
jgi:ribosomal protein S18 acetylase RimI-like enzyme